MKLPLILNQAFEKHTNMNNQQALIVTNLSKKKVHLSSQCWFTMRYNVLERNKEMLFVLKIRVSKSPGIPVWLEFRQHEVNLLNLRNQLFKLL